MKSRGPRTELYGTPYEEVCEEERVLPHLTRKEHDERFDEKKTQLMTVPWNWKPNQDDRRMRRIV